MLEIKAMFNRIEGYKSLRYANTVEEAREFVNAMKCYYGKDLIDIYYCYAH